VHIQSSARAYGRGAAGRKAWNDEPSWSGGTNQFEEVS
jgi:hypothetical protein